MNFAWYPVIIFFLSFTVTPSLTRGVSVPSDILLGDRDPTIRACGLFGYCLYCCVTRYVVIFTFFHEVCSLRLLFKLPVAIVAFEHQVIVFEHQSLVLVAACFGSTYLSTWRPATCERVVVDLSCMLRSRWLCIILWTLAILASHSSRKFSSRSDELFPVISVQGYSMVFQDYSSLRLLL